MEKIICYSNEMFCPRPSGFIILYKVYQSIYDLLMAKYDNVIAMPGINEEYIKSLPKDNNKILILDD